MDEYEPREPSDVSDSDQAYITDKELDALKDEVDTLYEGDTVQAASTMLEHKLMGAVHAISVLGQKATAERVRLDANKYLVDRVLGPLNKIQPEIDEKKDPLSRLLRAAGFTNGDDEPTPDPTASEDQK